MPTVNLPTNCFCRGHGGKRGGSATASVGAVVPLSDLLRAVEKAGTDFRETEEGSGERCDTNLLLRFRELCSIHFRLLFVFRVFRKWSVDKSGLKVEAVFLVEGRGGGDIVPFSFRVEHNGERWM